MAIEKSWILPTTIHPVDTICVDLHIPDDPAYVQAFFGCIEQLAKAYHHEDPMVQGSEVAYVWRDVIDDAAERLRTGGSCSVYQLRNSPTVDCMVEQSLDGGLTWIDAFTLRDCIADVVRPIIEAEGEDLVDKLLDKWDGTAQSITDNLVYDGTGDDVFRDIALCNALQLFVDVMMQAEIDRRFKAVQVWENMEEVFIASAAALLILPIPGARFVAAGLVFIAPFLEGGLAVWGAISQAVLENETNRDKVACAMYKNMKGATPTFSAFQTSLDSSDIFFLDPAYEVLGAVKHMIQELEVFVTFLQIWDSIVPMTRAGYLDACSCPDDGWRVEFLGGHNRPPNWAFVANTPYDLATYNSPGDYWLAADTPSQPDSSAFCTIEFSIAGTFELDWIMWDIDLDSTGTNTFNSGQQEWLYDDVGALIVNHNNPGYHQNNTPATVGWDTVQTGIQTVRLQARIYDPEDNVNTYAHLKGIVIKGKGIIPPEWLPFQVG